MSFIDEQTVWASVVGQLLNPSRLEEIAVCTGNSRGNYADCSEYLITNIDMLDKTLSHRFRITPALIRRWYAANVTFQLYLYLHEERLIGGHIYKFKRTSDDDYPGGYPMAPTQQEIRITGRVLRFLAEESHKQ